MTAILGFQDVLEVVTIEYNKLSEKLDEPQAKEVKKRDYNALFILHQCVDSGNYEKIQCARLRRMHGICWSRPMQVHKRSRK